jgi:cold shock CspA family protein
VTIGSAPTRGVPLGARQGTVVEFDDPRGLGVVRADDGVDYPFHCTAVADGTRSIAEGSSVSFRVVPGRLGRWEAAALTPATPTAGVR